ncbi:uncharacterized protein TNCV_1988371 [Trichonephila clavipes]|nr:uncharacterized protein TNCV_1988371 [Trichonephila clavipes]
MEETISTEHKEGASNPDTTSIYLHDNTRNTNTEINLHKVTTENNFGEFSSGKSEALITMESEHTLNYSTDKPGPSGDAFSGKSFHEDSFDNILKESHSSMDEQSKVICVPYSESNASLPDNIIQNIASCKLSDNKDIATNRNRKYQFRNPEYCILPKKERIKNDSTLQDAFQFASPKMLLGSNFKYFQTIQEKNVSDEFQKITKSQKKDETIRFKNALWNSNMNLRKKKSVWSSSSSSVNLMTESGIKFMETKEKTKTNHTTTTQILNNPESSESSHVQHFLENVSPNTISETTSLNDCSLNSNDENPISSRTDNGNTSYTYQRSRRKCNHSDPKSDLHISLPKSRTRKNKTKAKSPILGSNVNNCRKRSKLQLFYNNGLQVFIVRTMTETHPNLSLASDVPLKIEMFLWDIIHRIGEEAEILISLSNKKVLDKRVLKYAIKLSLEKMKNESDVVAGKRRHSIHFQWIPSHVGIEGNEKADFLARTAAVEGVSPRGNLIFSEISTISKLELNRQIKTPPSHAWYFAKCPGESFRLSSRPLQSTYSRFLSGHTRALRFSNGQKTFPECLWCSSGEASPNLMFYFVWVLKRTRSFATHCCF